MSIVAKFFHNLKKVSSIILRRPVVIGLLIVLQIVLIFLTTIYLGSLNTTIYNLFKIISMIALLWIISRDINPSFKISWLSLFFFFPLVGGIFYMIFANRRLPRELKNHMSAHIDNIKQSIPLEIIAEPSLERNLVQSRYIHTISSYPTLSNTTVDYYSLGETFFHGLMADLKKAKKYIFLEFFIIAKGQLLDDILEVLRQKVKEGVNVYFLYDNIGSLFTVPVEFPEIMKSYGIKCHVFNPFKPRMSPILNYRDHRKIVVIDGTIAYCGGANIADEYINKLERFGHWKDTGVRLYGDAAWSFALMFLQQWRFTTGIPLNIVKFLPPAFSLGKKDGFLQVYGDDPLNKYSVAENAYMRAIVNAKDYIYITTPYLVIDYAMENALCTAALSGVDVRILTPFKYDKWYVHMMTRSHYRKLIEYGVKIYEYTPGFVHSKMFVSDDVIGMVGTSNMDFRSFYHHFECSVLLYENSKLKDIKTDILSCTNLSHQMTLTDMKKQSALYKIIQSVLKLFEPLL